MSEQLVLIVCGILGVVFHSTIKCKGLLEDARVANINFEWKKDYVKKDFAGILASFLAVAIWYFIFGEAAKAYSKLQAFPRISFFVMGGIGSWGLQLLLGTAKKGIRKIVDKKTDIADGKIPNND